MEGKYMTQSLYESSYLMAEGYDLAGKTKDGNKMSIYFKPSASINEAAIRFYNGGKVEAKKLCDSYRTLKDYIFTK